MFKKVYNSLYINELGEWRIGTRGNKQPIHGNIGGKPYVLYDGKQFRTHFWIAKLFLENPDDLKFVRIKNKKLPVTIDNVEFHRGPLTKLTQAKVDKMRAEMDKGVTVAKIAEKYGMDRSAVYRIKKGQRWG